MSAHDPFVVPEVQGSAEHRTLSIERPGVRGLRYLWSIAYAFAKGKSASE